MSAGLKPWKPYPAYKDSGVEWLGMVPEGWDVVKIKHLTSKVGSGKTPSGGASAYQDSGILFLRSQNVYDEKLELGDVVYISDEIDSEMRTSRVLPGDVLLNITGASLGRTYRVPLDFPLANVNQHVCILRFGDTAGFAAWMMKSTLMKAQIAFCQSGAAREGLNFEEIRALFFPLPPLPEQNAIAAFLDQQCAQIDSLIEKKQRMIGLLDEKRRAVITQAVTRGLDPTVPMKNSGVEWLGKVPEGWEVKRLKYIATCNDEILPETTDEDYSFQYVDISSVSLIEGIQCMESMTFEKAPSRARRIARKGDCIVSTVRTYLKAIAPIMFDIENLIVSTGFAVIRPSDEMAPDFVKYYVQSTGFIDDVCAKSVGVSYPAINPSTLVCIYCAFPPLQEQRAIAEYLDVQCAAMDSQRKNLEKSIELLREYRASLITHAVTGKIDVRDAAPLQ